MHRSTPLRRATAQALLALVVVAAPSAARAESFAFTADGADVPVILERVAVAHGGGATVTTVSLVTASERSAWLVELPEGTDVTSVGRVASPFEALDAMATARLVVAEEIDPCDTKTEPSTTPPLTCAGVPGASVPGPPLGMWDAHFRTRPRIAPVTLVSGHELSEPARLGAKLPERAVAYGRAHPQARFALTDAEAIAFKGRAPTFLWPSRTTPSDGGPAWVELTALDREQREPRLPTLRRARVADVVLKAWNVPEEERGAVRLSLAREVLSRTGADVLEEVVAPHACLVDATEAALVALGFSELPPGRAAAGFDPSNIPEPTVVRTTCPDPRLDTTGTHCLPCTPSTTVIPPRRELAYVPAFWPSFSRWLGPPGHSLELEIGERSTAPKPVLPTYEALRRWTNRLRCSEPKPGRYKRTSPVRRRWEHAPGPVTYPPYEASFAATFWPTLSLSISEPERESTPEGSQAHASSVTPPWEAVAAPTPASTPRGPRGCTCDTIPAPTSGHGAALAAFAIAVLGVRRRARP
jgi:hypothetical protein